MFYGFLLIKCQEEATRANWWSENEGAFLNFPIRSSSSASLLFPRYQSMMVTSCGYFLWRIDEHVTRNITSSTLQMSRYCYLTAIQRDLLLLDKKFGSRICSYNNFQLLIDWLMDWIFSLINWISAQESIIHHTWHSIAINLSIPGALFLDQKLRNIEFFHQRIITYFT